MKPQSVPCPVCRRPAVKSCLTSMGRRAHYSHVARKRAATLEKPEPPLASSLSVVDTR